MKTLTVGFSRPKTWKPFSWLIMAGYGIPYDHVVFKYHSDELQADMIFQASGLSVNLMSLEVFMSSSVMVSEFPITLSDEGYARLLAFAGQSLGEPYGIKECVGLAIVRLAQLVGVKMSNPFRFDGKTFVCSELVGYLLDMYDGAKIDTDPANITPKTVFDYLTSQSSSIK